MKIDNLKIPQNITFAENGEMDVTTAKCGGVAYSGSSVNYYGANFVVDLQGLKIAEQIPILYNHENVPAYRLGIANVQNDGEKLTFDGEIDAESQIGKWLTTSGKKWKWQVSIGFNVEPASTRYVSENETVEVNGQSFSDCYIATKSKLREISLCAVGADDKTSLEIKMSLDNYFKFSQTNNKQEGGKMSEETTKKVENPAPAPQEDLTKKFEAKLDQFGAKLEELEKKNEELTKQNEELANENKKFKAQSDRPVPMMNFNNVEAKTEDVLEHALAHAFGVKMDNDCKAAEIADKKFRGGIGIKDAIFLSAKACGYVSDLMKSDGDIIDALSTIKLGWTNVNLPIVLGNLINKKIADGYNYVEQAWREIANIIPLNDFRDYYTCRLTAGGEFEEVPAGGKIPMGGPITESTYSVRAKTYGMMFALDRQTIRNDATNDIATKAFEFGRKGGLKINDIFWAVFLNNSSFFSAGNNNLLTSAGALSIDSLTNLVAKFDALTDGNGAPIGIDASKLLVSPSNAVMAEHLYADSEIRNTTSNKEYFTKNPWVGKFKPVKSRYLSNSKYTGYSADDYYLLADPVAVPAIQIGFLDGKETPYIESSAAEFDTLGIQWRGYFDFGVTLADPNGGVKADKA